MSFEKTLFYESPFVALLLAVKMHINLKSICLHYSPNRSCLSIFSFSMLFFSFPCLLACTRASLLLLLYNTCSRINLVRRDRTDWFIHRFLIPCVPSTYVPYIFQNVLAALALWNLTIYNIIRWFLGSLGQMTSQPSIWCSKHYSFYNLFFDLGHLKLFIFVNL